MALKPREQLEWVWGILADLQQHFFYGRVTVEFQGGSIIRIVKEESLKPDEYPEDKG